MANAILLAEDSPDDVTLFLDVMRRSRLINPVFVVQDGVETLQYLKGQGKFADRDQYPMPSILLLDLRMPRMDGFQVLEWIYSQSHLTDLLVVVLSHYGETNDINRAYTLGAHTFLVKPFTQKDLTNLASYFDGRWEKAPSNAD